MAVWWRRRRRSRSARSTATSCSSKGLFILTMGGACAVFPLGSPWPRDPLFLRIACNSRAISGLALTEEKDDDEEAKATAGVESREEETEAKSYASCGAFVRFFFVFCFALLCLRREGGGIASISMGVSSSAMKATAADRRTDEQRNGKCVAVWLSPKVYCSGLYRSTKMLVYLHRCRSGFAYTRLPWYSGAREAFLYGYSSAGTRVVLRENSSSRAGYP